MASASLLESVAMHEESLMSRVQEAEEQAQRILDEARAAAAARGQEEHARVEAEIARMRREAAEARDIEQRAIQQAGENKVAEIRSSATARLERATQEILQQVLPQGIQGSGQ